MCLEHIIELEIRTLRLEPRRSLQSSKVGDDIGLLGIRVGDGVGFFGGFGLRDALVAHEGLLAVGLFLGGNGAFLGYGLRFLGPFCLLLAEQSCFGTSWRGQPGRSERAVGGNQSTAE